MPSRRYINKRGQEITLKHSARHYRILREDFSPPTIFEEHEAKKFFSDFRNYQRFMNLLIASPKSTHELYTILRQIKNKKKYIDALTKYISGFPLGIVDFRKFGRTERLELVKEYNEKIGVFSYLVEAEQELGVPKQLVTSVLFMERNKIGPYLENILKEYFLKRKLGIEIGNIHPDGKKLFGSRYILARILGYNRDYLNTKNEAIRKLWRNILKHYFAEGQEGLKHLKFSRTYELLKHENMSLDFAKKMREVEKAVGSVKGFAGMEFDLYKDFSQKLDDFESHLQNTNINEMLEVLKHGIIEKLYKIDLKMIGLDVDNLIELIKSGDMEKIKEINAALKRTQVKTRAQGAVKNALIGILTELLAGLEIETGIKIVRELKKLKGLDIRQQYLFLEKIKEKYGEDTLKAINSVATKLIEKEQKPVFADMKFFIERILNPPLQGDGGSVVAKVTFDFGDFMHLGEYQNNCQNVGMPDYNYALISFMAEPTEFTIAYYSNEEIIGFSFAHFVKNAKGELEFVIERPYTNSHLRTAMENANKTIAERIRKELGIHGGIREEMVGKKVKALASIYDVGKYYDCRGGKISPYGESFTIV